MTKDQYQKALSYSLKLIKRRLRSTQELRDKLKLKKYPNDIIERIIKEFKQLNYLNDKEFAKAWVNDRINLNPKAPRLLKLELRQKGVSQRIIDEVLNDIIKQYNFKDIAFDLAKSRHETLKGLSDIDKKKRRIFDYLRRRGFDYSIIYQVIDKLFEKDEG